MESSYNSCSPKYLKTSPHTTLESTAGEVGRHIHPQESFGLDYEAEEQQKRVHNKPKVMEKLAMNEQNKPLEIMLPTQLGEVKHPGFNYMQMVATKMYLLEQEKQLEKKVQKIIEEEEEVRRSRNEMIAKAQLMPFCDRPFFPQRSTRPLPVPKEPIFHFMNNKCWGCLSSNALSSFETLRSKL